MANTAGYVTTGKPNISGGIWCAPKGTTLPTDATTALDTTKFVCLGYVSEDGLENNNEMDVSAIKAWGGNIVYRSLTEMTDEFSFSLIETENVDVLKAVYEVFDPTMFDDNGFKKWCCAMTDEDSEAIALDENLRVKDSVYGDVKFEDVEE